MASSTTTRPRAAGVRVRGFCRLGHVVETIADKGRVTAQLVCQAEGCTDDKPVHCRRIPKDATPPPPPAGDAGSTRIVRIADYDVTASGAADDPGGLIVADVEPEPDPGRRDGPDPAGRPLDPIGEDGQDTGLLGRFRARRRAAAVRSARSGWQHPLGL